LAIQNLYRLTYNEPGSELRVFVRAAENAVAFCIDIVEILPV
jgi:hypothetical protein